MPVNGGIGGDGRAGADAPCSGNRVERAVGDGAEMKPDTGFDLGGDGDDVGACARSGCLCVG